MNVCKNSSSKTSNDGCQSVKCKIKKIKLKLSQVAEKVFSINKILIYLCIASIYVLLSSTYEFMRIPSRLWDNGKYSFNELIVGFASSLLTGCLVYFLTVVLKNSLERKRRKWEIYDYFHELDKANIYLEMSGGKRCDIIDFYWYKNYYGQYHDRYIGKIRRVLYRRIVLKDILTTTENNLLNEINTNISVEPYNEHMVKMEIEVNFNKLQRIVTNIIKLNNGIIKYVRK